MRTSAPVDDWICWPMPVSIGDRADHLSHQADERDQAADGEVTVEDEPRAETEHDDLQHGDDHVDRQPEQPAEELEVDLAVEEPVGRLPEPAALAGLEPERLDHGLRQ